MTSAPCGSSAARRPVASIPGAASGIERLGTTQPVLPRDAPAPTRRALEHDDAHAPRGDRVRAGEADDPAADDRDVEREPPSQSRCSWRVRALAAPSPSPNSACPAMSGE